jgi:hypothetical protein
MTRDGTGRPDGRPVPIRNAHATTTKNAPDGGDRPGHFHATATYGLRMPCSTMQVVAAKSRFRCMS